jgi:hypothetical protein
LEAQKIFSRLFCADSLNVPACVWRKRITLERGRFLEAAVNQPFKEGASMRKNSKHVPPALKHGIYSALGLLPTESPAKFRKFRRQIFAELNLVGRVEDDIGEQIVRLEWRRQNFSTYDLAERARAWRNAIRSELVPEVRSSLPTSISRTRRLRFLSEGLL